MSEKAVVYADMVRALAKPGERILATMTPLKAHILHMAVGISGEAGELLDAVKKASVHDKALDRVNVIEELGDMEFYMEGLRQALGITRRECIETNIAKLMTGKNARYASGQYSDEQAHARADKQGEKQ